MIMRGGKFIYTFSRKNLEGVGQYCYRIFTQYNVKMWTEILAREKAHRQDVVNVGMNLEF